MVDGEKVEPRTHEAMAPGAVAQAVYYRELSERFARMAAEFEPDTLTDPSNPLPHHGITAVIVLHGNDHAELADRLREVEINWYHLYTEYGTRAQAEWTSNGHIWFRTVDPEMTPELYRAEVDRWHEALKAGRAGR